MLLPEDLINGGIFMQDLLSGCHNQTLQVIILVNYYLIANLVVRQ